MTANDRRMVEARRKMAPYRSIDLTQYEVIVANTSAGKDSLVSLDVLAELAREQGVMDRVTVVHADLGRCEWEGVAELAARQAARYGWGLTVVQRPGNDLLDQVEHERKAWPAMGIAQFCTSDHKTSQVAKLVTKLVGDVREAAGFKRRSTKRHVKVLQVLGIRAQESKRRADKQPYYTDERRSNSGKTEDIWYPVFDWTTEEVWERINGRGLEAHHAYELGMSRLSCCFCVLASLKDLRISGRQHKELLGQYVGVEKRINHTFKNGWAIEDLWNELYSGEPTEKAPAPAYVPPPPSAFGFSPAA